MRLAAQTLRANLRSSPLVVLGFAVFFAAAAYETARLVLAGDTTGLALVAMAAVLCILVVAILNDWRKGLYLFLAWLLFEDLARKYLGNNMAIYFAKDFLLLVIYISFLAAFRRKQISGFRPPFLIPLLLFVWFGVVQIFNPASTHIIYGLLGFKLFFYYVPLMFVGYALINSEAELRRFFFVNLALAAIIGGLGIAQAILGHTFLNPSNPADEIRELSTLYRAAPISGAIFYRPTSVFVSTGRFGDFLLVAWLLVFGFAGYLLLRHKRGRTFAFLVTGIMAAALLLGSSRGVVMWGGGSALVGAFAFVWGAPWRQREVMRVLRTLQRAIAAVALGVVLLLLLFPEALLSRMAFYTETLSPTSSASDLQNRTWDYPVRNFLAAFTYERWPYGYGIGTTALGTQYVAKFFHAKPPVLGVESGFGTLVVEMGIGGLVLWLVMSFAILVSAWRVVKKLRGSPWFPIAFMIFWYAGLLLIPITYAGMAPYQDFVMNAYLWLLLGILFRLPSLAASAQFAAIQPGFQFQQSLQQPLRQPRPQPLPQPGTR
ncbi:MAG TPA: hypothetical protein VJN89_02835 [Candidatus Acidoferrum sp.]|nr:hypothetical protein [Candidatus Acidoferrum sp.]